MAQASPQYSADGKWWWDGATWRPATAQTIAPKPILPRTQRTRGRKAAIVVVAVVAGLGVGLFAIRSMVGFIGTAQMEAVSIDATASKQSMLGGTSSFSVTVANAGSDIKNFVIITNIEGRDNWLKHHSITDSGSCAVDHSRDRLACGPIAKGSTKTFTIQAISIDAGSFSYMLQYGDDRGGGWLAAVAGADIASSTRQYEWNEVVLH